MRLATLELHKEFMKFSAGHVTIFSKDHRENMHGHNFRVRVHLTMPVNENGMTVDYNFYKKLIKELCHSLNNFFLIPADSPYLSIHEDETRVHMTFNGETISFPHRDVKCLPLRNITVEELSFWFIEQLIRDTERLESHRIQAISVKVNTGPGQGGRTDWTRQDGYAQMD